MAYAVLKYEAGLLKRYGAAAAMSAGDVEVIGNRVCPLEGTQDVEAGDDYCVHTVGVFTMAAKSTDAWDDGDLLYWDATLNQLTDTAGSNKSAGLAVGAKSASATTAVCDINASVASGTV